MNRTILAFVLSLITLPALAQAETPLRPAAFDLAGMGAEVQDRACRGPGGRLVQCPQPNRLR